MPKLLDSYRSLLREGDTALAVKTDGNHLKRNGKKAITAFWPMRRDDIKFVIVFLDLKDKGKPNKIFVGRLEKKESVGRMPEGRRSVEKFRLHLSNYWEVGQTNENFTDFFDMPRASSRIVYLPRDVRGARREVAPVAVPARVIFARCGYMRFYNGSQTDDPRPVGGGKFNDRDVGGEVFNFAPVDGSLYGYVQPQAQTVDNSCINLGRIDASCDDAELSDVLVLFFAPSPDKTGPKLVGWYQGGTVFRDVQQPTGRTLRNRERRGFNIVAPTASAVLLPGHRRPYLSQSRQKAGMPGQANVFYLLDEKGEKRNLQEKRYRWIPDILAFVRKYDGENILNDPQADIQPELANAVENALQAASGGQGFNVSPEVRKAIEDRSMARAKSYFRGQGYRTVDVSKSRSFDLLCMKDDEELRVEVKGTQTTGQSILLTPNEVESVKRNRTALFVLHSIEITTGKRGVIKASGGKQMILHPWNFDSSALKAITFAYDLSRVSVRDSEAP